MSEETTTSQTTGMQEPITESMASEESLLASPPAPGLATSGEAMAQTGGTGKRLFVAVGDGYSGYYAVEESIRMKLFDQVVVAVIAPEAVQVLKNLSPSTVTAHVVQVDSVSSIAEAARGCTVAYIVPPARDDKIDLASKMIAAVKEAGITKCAILSSIGADAENKPALAKFREIERIFKQAGFESSCILRGGFYSQNLLLYVDQINNQQLKLPIGEGKMAPVDIQDMSGAAMKVCANIEEHNQQVYSLIGDQLVDGYRIADACSSILQKEIRFQPISRDEERSIVEAKTGLDASEANYLMEFYDLVREGQQEFVSDDVRRLLEQTPTNVEGFLQKHLIDITVPHRAELKASGA